MSRFAILVICLSALATTAFFAEEPANAPARQPAQQGDALVSALAR